MSKVRVIIVMLLLCGGLWYGQNNYIRSWDALAPKKDANTLLSSALYVTHESTVYSACRAIHCSLLS